MTFFYLELQTKADISAPQAKELFWNSLETKGYNPNKYMQSLRITLTGEASGPDLMTIISLLGSKKTAQRIKNSIALIGGKA